MLSLLASSTPAAPQTIVGVTTEWRASLAFWMRVNDFPGRLYGRLTGQNVQSGQQAKQQDRDARVSRIQIYPGDVTLHVDQRVHFVAIAYDEKGAPLSGVRFTWEAQLVGNGQAVPVSPHGEFEAMIPGNFKVTAQGAAQTAEVKVIVLDGPHLPGTNETPISVRRVSNREGTQLLGSRHSPGTTNQKSNASAQPTSRLSRRAAAFAHSVLVPPMPLPPDDGWNDGNFLSSSDPRNRRGDPPGASLDGGAGSSNFQFAAPVFSSAGRDINISLGLAGNSRLWNKSGNSQITYDIDRDWPAPGFSLGFGKILWMGVTSGSMIVDADGTRHSYSGTLSAWGAGQQFAAHTTDGTLIDYTTNIDSTGALFSAQARLANGTVISYGVVGTAALYPDSITDPNGNFIIITYVNNTGPQIQTVTDTLGRVISFYYDSNNLLTAITAPGLNGGAARTLVRLHYKQISLAPSSYSFNQLTTVVRNQSPWVIDAIYYPPTGTGYWLGDSASTGYLFGNSDSYSTYGMLAKVVEVRGMTFSGPDPTPPAQGPTGQGTITFAGQMTRKEVYNYPLYVGDTSGTTSSYLTDAPTYTSMTDTWTRDGSVTDQAVTNYEVHQDATPRTVTITLPNGTKSKQYSYNAPGQYYDGLVYRDETYVTPDNILQSSSSTWAQGAYDSPRPTRVEATDERGQTTATDFIYGGAYNQVTEVRNYDYGGINLVRSTRTQYQNDFNYTNNHIFNLPLVVEIYAADNTTRVSRTEYQYDGQTLTDTPGVVMHSNTYDPYVQYWVPGHYEWDRNCGQYGCYVWVPGHWETPYRSWTDYRGNVTQITTYADAINLAGSVTETRRYDIDGNLITASTSCCQQTSFNYTVDTQYAYPLSQTRGSASDAYAQITTTGTYDFNTGLVLAAKDANGRESTTTYDANTLRPQTVSLPTGAHTDYAYNDTAMTVTETTYLAASEGGGIADQNVKLLNGMGQVWQEQARAPDEGGNQKWDYVDTTFDNMGRVSQQSRPYRSGDTLQWTTPTYDALGRTTIVIAPDGSTTKSFYNETNRPPGASSLPGEVTRVQDAWGRERWGRTDAQGHLVEVAEPNPGSTSGSVFDSGALITTYAYNTLGDLVTVNQGAQTRSFKYDSLGRLTAQKLAETSATLNDAGVYQTSGGTWSDVFAYDERSNLTSRTDARGVKTVYDYNGDPLNRLQSVSWDTTGFGDTSNPILSAATVNYQYRTKSSGSQLLDVTQLSSVTTTGISTESYSYDSEGRASSKSLTLTSRASYPFVTDYIYDTLDRITDVRYPAEYGNGTQPRKVVDHDFDIASRLTGLTVDGASHASQIVYNAASQTTQLKVGASGANQITENYGYDSQTGLLASQTVVRGTSPSATTLLDLAYDYAGTNGKRTGQLTKILNNLNLNHNKDRSYTYDALGRLVEAKGGPVSAPLWTQTYSYDRYGNRLSVSATGYSARNKKNGSEIELAKAGSAGILPATSALLVPPAVADGSSAAIAPPSDPQVSLPTEQVTAKTMTESPDSRRTGAPRSTSNSHHASRSTRPSPVTPQGPPPPVFTDPDLLASGGIQIKALHITELRTAINTLRTRLGLSGFSWQTSAASGGLVKADPILEMRTALDQALGAPPAPGYSPGLAQYQLVLAIHIQELRNRVVAAWSSSSAIPRDGLASVSYDVTSNRITTAGFDYDKAGNQVRALAPGSGSQRFQYDAANRLVKVKADDNVTVLATYTYGASNERLIADAGGQRTYYACNASTEYVESGGSTTPQWSKTYIYLGARLLSTLTPNGSGGELVQYHHPDRLGTRLVTNAQDTTYFEQVTLPFGTALNAESTGSTNRRFTSYDRSAATGLDYAVNRHYDSQQGRFTQVDPAGMKATSFTSPQTLNLYAYCTNDPINHTDPSGLGFFSKLWHAIKKVLSNKWVMLALTVALTVIAVGAALHLIHLTKIFQVAAGASGYFDAAGNSIPIMITMGHAATTAGWIAAGIGAAASLSTLSFSIKSILGNALSMGLGWAKAHIPSGDVGPGGTPPFSFQATEQALTAIEGNLVWNAMELARKALDRPECRKFVGEGAYAALRKQWDSGRITYFPGVQFGAGQPQVWAQTQKGLFSGKIVLSYSWMYDNQDVAMTAAFHGISSSQFRATVLLHETRHLLGDGYIEPDTPGNWDSQIAKNCFK